MKNHHISKKEVQNTLETLYKHIETTSPIPVHIKTDHKKSGGALTRKPPYIIVIGTYDINQNTFNDYIQDNAFVFTVLVCFHEQQHIEQQNQFINYKTPDTKLKQLAYTDLLNSTIPEYYKYGYWNDMTEIDAELYAITETQKFFQENFPEISIDNELIEINKKSKWNNNTTVHTIDQIIYNLEKAKEQAYDKPIPLPIRYTKNQKYSPNLQAFIKDESRRQAYIRAYDNHNGQAANQLLLDFIKEELPWRFRDYPCLQDEWTDTVRTANPTMIDKLTGHKREDITQEIFDKRIQQLEAAFPNFSDDTLEKNNDFSL